MDAVPAEPGSLIEAVRGRPWQPEPTDEVEVGALWRRAPERQLEEHRLADGERAEPGQLRGNPQLEAAPPRRSGDDDQRRLRLADVREQGARVERVEARAPPPPAR